MKTKKVFLGLVSALLCAGMTGCNIIKPFDPSENDIKIMSANLDQGHQNNSTFHSKVKAKFDAENPDLLGVQEEGEGWVTALESYMAGKGYTHVYQSRGGSYPEASGIFIKNSRFTIKDSGTFWFGDDVNAGSGYIASEWGANYPRVCSWALLTDKQTEKDICYFNAHLEYGHAFDSLADATEDNNNIYCRYKSCKQVISRMSALGVPGFFTGDLNSFRGEEPAVYNACLQYFDDAWADYPNSEQMCTFHNYGSELDPTTRELEYTPIDYIYSTKGYFDVQNFNILENSGTSESDFDSDHFFVTAQFRYRDTRREFTPVHACEHVCPQCGKCLDEGCEHANCIDKCNGHGPEVVDVAFDENDRILLECEEGYISGTMTGTDPTDAFVAGRTSNNPDHPTSGEADANLVFNWAAQGNKVAWKINMAEAEEGAVLTLWCCAGSNQNSSGLQLKVNGTVTSWNEGTVIGKGSEDKWYYWNPITTRTSLAEGVNTIELINASGQPWNLDCLVISKYVEPSFDRVLTFVDGKAIIECESADTLVGCAVGNNAAASNGQLIGDWNDGASATYNVFVEKDVTVKVAMAACCWSDPGSNGVAEFRVNGTRIDGETDHLFPSTIVGGGIYHSYTMTAQTHAFELKAGNNVINIAKPWAVGANLDYIEFTDVNYVHVHTYADGWTTNDTHHWKAATCSHTDLKDNYGEHDFIQDPNKTNVPATEQQEGANYFICSVCGKEKVEIIPALEHVHTYAGGWTTNDTHHWHASTCGHDTKSGYAEHSFGEWTVTKEAAVGVPGAKERICSECGYKQEEVIPALNNSFVKDRILLECEKGTITGTMTGTDPNDAFVSGRDSNNPSHPTSGEAGANLVFNWAAPGNKVAWTINLAEKADNVVLKLWCCAGSNQAASGLQLVVNGETISWDDSTVLGKGFSDNQWYYWNSISTRANLKAGENTIEIINASGQSWNLDCLEILRDPYFVEFDNGVYQRECETANAYNGCSVGSNAAASNGHNVGGDWKYGSSVEYKIYVKETVTVKITICGAEGMCNGGNTDDNGIADVKLDGTQVANGMKCFRVADGWHNYVEATASQTFTLTAGEHTLRFEGPWGTYGNLDYFKLTVVA